MALCPVCQKPYLTEQPHAHLLQGTPTPPQDDARLVMPFVDLQADNERLAQAVRQLQRERDDSLSRWHQMKALQAALLELDDEARRLRAAIEEHHDKMTGMGSAGGEHDRKLWASIILTTYADGTEWVAECQEFGCHDDGKGQP